MPQVKGATEGLSFDVILTTHNRLDLTIACIKALYTYTPASLFNLIVIDESSDLTPQWFDLFCKEQSNCKYFHFEASQIKCGNHCWLLGLEHCTKDIVVTLVNSATVEPDWFGSPLSLLNENPQIGAVGLKLLYPHGVIWHAGKGFNNSLPIHIGLGEPAHRHTHITQVPCINHSVGFFRKEALVQSLDIDTYIGWRSFEHDDLCLTIRKNGYKILYCGFASAYHIESPTRLGDNPDKQKFWQEYNENMRRFLVKWQGSELLVKI